MHPLSGSLGSIPAWGSKIPQVLRFSPPPKKKVLCPQNLLISPNPPSWPPELCLDSYNSFLIAYKATALKPLHLNLNTVAKWLFKTVRLSHPLLNNSDIASGSEERYTNFTESLMTVQSPPCHPPTLWLSSLTAAVPSPLRHSGCSAASGTLHLLPPCPGLCPRWSRAHSLSSFMSLLNQHFLSEALSTNPLHTPQPSPALSHGIYRDLTYKISRLFFILSLPTNRQN